LKHARKISFESRIVTVKNDIANVCIVQGQNGKAIKEINSVKAYANKSYRIAVPQILIRLAKIYISQKDLTKADKILDNALKIAKNEKWQRDVAEAYIVKSEIAKINKDQQKVAKYEKLAHAIISKLKIGDRE